MICRIISGLRMNNSVSLHNSTKFKETLGVTDDKEYRVQGLAHISDEAFLFICKLEETELNC